MKIKNSIAYDYSYKKELEALTTYEINMIDKDFEILKNIFLYSDNAEEVIDWIFIIRYYRSENENKYFKIYVEKMMRSILVSLSSTDEFMQQIITTKSINAGNLFEAHDFINYYIGKLQEWANDTNTDIILPQIKDEQRCIELRKLYFKTLEEISNGKVYDIDERLEMQ